MNIGNIDIEELLGRINALGEDIYEDGVCRCDRLHQISNIIRDCRDALKQNLVVQKERVGDYEIYGNMYIAIAVNVNNPKDSHYFDIDPEVNNNAFVRACGWAYEPPFVD